MPDMSFIRLSAISAIASLLKPVLVSRVCNSDGSLEQDRLDEEDEDEEEEEEEEEEELED